MKSRMAALEGLKFRKRDHAGVLTVKVKLTSKISEKMIQKQKIVG